MKELSEYQRNLVITGKFDPEGEITATVNGARPLRFERAQQLCPHMHPRGDGKAARELLAVAILCEYLPEEAGTAIAAGPWMTSRAVQLSSVLYQRIIQHWKADMPWKLTGTEIATALADAKQYI